MIRILIVDNQPMIRAGIHAILASQNDMSVVGEAENGRIGVERARSLRPDVVLMDVRMPELDGLAATAELLDPRRAGERPPRVLMLTTFDIDDYVYAALRAGASGFLLKDTEPEELIQAVRVIAAGEALLSPSVTRRLIENFIGSQPVTPASTVLNILTDREREVLRLMATGSSNAEIAATLFIAEQTTKTHVSRILNKLGLRDRVHAVVFGYENGLVTPGRRNPG
ncbi:putative two-component system response regulator [Actinoplanes missouriensis 431]|uniref:Putative two-component system response regulator n=1 Tax=Actinoplanes missouriensis (strain ATCC 14538 / DSM 43046 / CBS 188.64 / JCM 3121 / NBRC 102363 / NCIMB 12654 / NRRL B-3342 / UNCC 431) TaxID=512565 RepID=I0H4G9_ACTM4|nr:response regulator transcription factor [Actinoplanes missouriensis]BAL87906.1 putative two-component system response regulator [Actinoplanes missouriensis 431]